jgi:hypothetical protein
MDAFDDAGASPPLTLEQTLEAERKAWVCQRTEVFYYDGSDFWQLGISSWIRPQAELPRYGWQHADNCPCQVCASARAA